MSDPWRKLWGGDWDRIKPFFSRFRSPTDVQRQAIPVIRSGRDALVVAPTASGKTEAILPPLLARYQDDLVPDEGPLVLYIAPTRALVSDIVQRIRDPIRRMGGVVGERTSDRRTWTGGDPCTALVTTPESLDSITMRSSESLSAVRGFITDEMHLLEGGPRGLQLRFVLERIEATVGRELQHVLASATLPHLEALAQRWCVEPELIEVGGAHDLEVTLVRRGQLSDSDWPTRVCQQIERHKSRKVLAFANSRVGVESLAVALSEELVPDGWMVRTHHSSLSTAERVQAERLFHERTEILVVATSTLEVGIDIGDVDLVILDQPPFTLNSFLQRLGRGCRRTDLRRVVGIADTPLDARVFEALTRAGRAGRSDGRLAPPLLAVAVQQIASSMRQKALETEPGRPPFLAGRAVEELLGPAIESQADCSAFCQHAVDAAVSVGLVEREERWSGTETFTVLTSGSDLPRAVGNPQFHVTFTPTGGDVDVVLEGSGRVIGGVALGSYSTGAVIQLSGRPWRVTQVHSGKLVVRPVYSSKGPPPGFNPQQGGNASEELAREVAKLVWPDWCPGKAAVYRAEDTHLYAHFIGYQTAMIFAGHLSEKGYEVSHVTPYSFCTDRRWEDQSVRPSASELADLAYRKPSLIENLEDLGRLYAAIRADFAGVQAQLAYDWEQVAVKLQSLDVCEVEGDDVSWGLASEAGPVHPL